MASEFLKKKAREREELTDKKYGADVYGGSSWRKESDEDTPENNAQNPSSGNNAAGSRASSFLQKKAAERATVMDNRGGEDNYGGSKWIDAQRDDVEDDPNIFERTLDHVKDSWNSAYEGVFGKKEEKETKPAAPQPVTDRAPLDALSTRIDELTKRQSELIPLISGARRGGLTEERKRFEAEQRANNEEINRLKEELDKARPVYSNDAAAQKAETLAGLEKSVQELARAFEMEQTEDSYNRYMAAYQQYSQAVDDYNAYMDYAQSDASGWKIAGDTVMAGIGTIGRGIGATMDFLLPAELWGEKDPLSKFINAQAEEAQYLNDRWQESIYGRGKLVEGASTIGKATVEAIPNAILAMMSGGTSVAAQGTAALGTAATGTGIGAAIGTVAKDMVKNPMYWSSMAQTLGPTYEEAKENGANEWQASATALISSMLNAGVEVKGGIEVLPAKIKSGNRSAVLEWVLSTPEEGVEEVIQRFISGTTDKVIYDHDKPLYSTTDPNAIVNPAEMGKEFALGTAVAGVLGGAQIGSISAANSMLNRINNRKLGQIGGDYQAAAQELLDEGLTFAPETEAYQTAAEVKAKMDAGETVTDADLGRVVVANERTIQREERNTASSEASQGVEDVLEEGDTQPTRKENAVQGVSVAKSVEKITGYGEHGASSFTGIVEATGRDPGDVKLEFESAYQAGRTGLPQSVARLDSNVRQEAYNAGRLDAIMAMNTAKEKAKGAVIRKDAGFDRAHLPSDVSEAQYKAVDMLAKATGVRVRMAKGLKGNAQIAEDGTVLIDETFQREVAGEKRSIVFYAAHEIGMHRLMQLAPEEGQAFINAVIQDANTGLPYGTPTVTEQKQAQYAAQNVSLDTGKAMEEVTADSILSLYDNEAAFYEAIDRIVNGKDEKAKQGAKKFKDILDDIVRKLKQAIAKLTGKEKVEAKQTLAEVEQLRDLFEKGLAAATERVKTENATNKPGRAAESRGKIEAQHSLKEDLKNGRERKETRAEFLRRAAGAGYAVYEGKAAAYGFRRVPGGSARENARQILEEVNRLNLTADIIDGPLLKNSGGITLDRAVRHAVTVDRARVFISNEANLPPRNIAGHEAFHLWESGVGREAYIETVEDNLLFTSKAFLEYQSAIAQAHLGGEADLANDEQMEILREETFAYISGDIHEGAYDDLMRPMFRNFDEVKTAWNELVAQNSGTQFSLKSPVEQTKNLIALHNLTEEKLRKALALGGFPMPSIAVTRTDIPHTNFGEITLVMNKSTIDPKASRKNTVYSADAWTPVFPKVEYEVDSRVAHEFYDKARKAEGRIPAEYVSKVNMLASSIDSYLNTYETEEGVVERFKDEYAIKALYLAEQGEGVETKTRENRTEKGKSPMLDAVLDVFDEDVETLGNIPLGELHDKYAEDIKRALVEHGRTEAAAEAMVAKKGGVFGFSKLMAKVLNYAREPEFTVETVTDTKAIEEDIDSRIDEAAYDKWLREMFRGLILDSGIHNGKDLYTASGNRKSFKQTHYPVTLENVAKAMASQNDGNSKHVSGFVGIKSLRAGTAVRFKSIAHMHELEGRLKHLTQEEADAINDALGKRLSDITERIYNKKQHSKYTNTFIEYDTIGNILMEVTELDKYTVDSIQKVFSQYQYNLGNQLAADIRDLLFDVTQMPVNIFEAKPERAVRFDEVLAAVLPDNADAKLREQLEQVGLNVLTYQHGDDASRIEAVNSVDNAQFSLKEHNDLLAENAKLKEVNQGLREQFKTTQFAKVDKKALRDFSKQLLKDYSSGADIDETRDALDGLYTYLANGEDGLTPSWNEAYKRAYEVAVSVLENATTLDDEMWRTYKDLRDRVRNVGISISPEYGSDLMGYEDLQDFRRRNFGRLNIVKNGTPVDSLYAELANAYPELFDEDRYNNQGDQLVHIADVLEEMKPIEINPYRHDMREAATWLANDIMERFFELPQAKPTFADKAEQKLTKQAIKDAKKLERLREQKNQRIAEIIADNREKVKATQTKERTKREEAVKKVKEHYKAKESKASESRKAKEMRAKILRHTTELSKKLLRASDKNHIPQELQGAVAKLLECINMESNYTYDPETDGYKKSDEGLPTLRTRLFANLRKIYANLANELTIDPDLLGEDGLLTDVVELADKKMADMNLTELETIWKTIRAIEASVTSANIAFNKARWETISEAAEALRMDNFSKKEKVELDGPGGVLGKAQKLTGLDMMTPEAYFHRLGKSGDGLFRMMRDAQDDHIRKMKEVSDFTHEALKGVNVRKLENQMHTVKLGEKDVQMSTAQIMELYVLMRREQSRDHIMVGGILPDVVSKGSIKKVSRAKPVRGVQPGELAKAFKLLTDEQIQIAEKLQEYASTELSKWGNEAAMKVYNYEKFGEKTYWPIRVNRQETQSNVQKDTQVTSVAGRGFTKGTKPHANNSVMVGSIFDTFSTHASEMATYASWLSTMEDINRIRNFTFKSEGTTVDTVKGIIDTVHGKAGTAYLSKLLADLSNGVKGTHGETNYMSGLVGNYKAASVGANLRVIIQQPTSLLRALDMLDPQYLVAGMRPENGWKKALKYVPIAQWKDWGYFDINTGRQMKDVLFDSDSKLNKVKNASMWGASKADSLSWGLLWNAVETETKHKRKDLTAGTEEFYQAVAERFNEIVDHTQVVDGILQRSQIMRSADGLTKMATSFMGEPTKQYNMMLSAVYDATHGNREARRAGKRRFMRSAVALLIAGVVNAMAQAVMDAVRDDDKEKRYWEKWLEALTGLTGEEETFGEAAKNAVLEGNLGSTFNPAAYIPYVKDAVSIIQGYDVSRMDMESIEKTLAASQNMVKALNGEGKYTISGAAAALFAEVARLAGVPVANLKREVKSFAMLAAIETDNYLMQYRMEKASLAMNYPNNKKTFMDILFNAYVNDQEAYELIYADMLKEDKLKTDKKSTAEVIADAMEERMKARQGVTEVKDLEQRYLTPVQQDSYDKSMAEIRDSGLWGMASADQRDAVEEMLYNLAVDSTTGQKLQEKIDGGAGSIDAEDYLLYRLALSIVDEPTESGKLGSYTQDEAAAAIEMLRLDDDASGYLWQSTNANWKDKNNPWW